MMQPYLTRTYCISIVTYLAFMQRLRSRLLQAAASLSFGWREMMSMQIRLGGESTVSSFKSRSNSVIQTRRCCALDNAGGGAAAEIVESGLPCCDRSQPVLA